MPDAFFNGISNWFYAFTHSHALFLLDLFPEGRAAYLGARLGGLVRHTLARPAVLVLPTSSTGAAGLLVDPLLFLPSF